MSSGGGNDSCRTTEEISEEGERKQNKSEAKSEDMPLPTKHSGEGGGSGKGRAGVSEGNRQPAAPCSSRPCAVSRPPVPPLRTLLPVAGCFSRIVGVSGVAISPPPQRSRLLPSTTATTTTTTMWQQRRRRCGNEDD